jgi:hypothetical protein
VITARGEVRLGARSWCRGFTGHAGTPDLDAAVAWARAQVMRRLHPIAENALTPVLVDRLGDWLVAVLAARRANEGPDGVASCGSIGE